MCKQAVKQLSTTFSIFVFVIYHVESRINYDEFSFDPLKAWSLPDATAFPDQAFIYNLPKEYEKYEVTELELNFLPEWLEYDHVDKKLVGLAKQADIGKIYFLEVKPAKHLWNSLPSAPVDIFKIEVENPNKEDFLNLHSTNTVIEVAKGKHSHHSIRAIHCNKNKPLTSTSIVLDLDYDSNLYPLQKVSLLQRFSGHYEISLRALKFLSYNQADDQNSRSNSILVAGPGDYRRDETAVKKNNVVLHWTVGCGSVQKKHLSALQTLEVEAKNGILKKVLKYSVVGWFVTNSKPKESEMRKRRYLQSHFYPTSTATITVEPITDTHSSRTDAPYTYHKHTKVPRPSKSKSHRNKKPPLVWTNSHVFEATKSLSVIKVLVGEVFRMEINRHFFSQPFRHLRLTTLGGQPLSSSSWLKLGSDHSLYGMPLWKHQGVQNYVLKATDSHNNEADLKLDFNVVPAVVDRALYEMNVVIENLNYERFVDEVDSRMDLAGKIASAFGDKNAHDVLMVQVMHGSVDYSWTNKSMLLNTLASKQRGCSVSAVRRLFDRFINSSTAHLQDSFLQAMQHYTVSHAEATPTGDCEKLAKGRVAHYINHQRVPKRNRQRFHQTGVTAHEITHKEVEEESHMGRVQNMDELLKQILIPSLIVLALVLLALLIACLAFNMCSHKKGDKLTGADDYIRKGTPVIFAHELDEHPGTLPSKRPLITTAQRSPKPPNYRQHMISATSAAANLPPTGKLYVDN